jgi:hypothetical protein
VIESSAVDQADSCWLLPAAARVRNRGKSSVGPMAGRAALGELLYSEYFGFAAYHSFHQFFHDHHHISSRAGTIRQ